MNRAQKSCSLLIVGILVISAAASAAPGGAATGRTFTDLPVFQKWLETYEKENGDHAVLLRLEPSRFFLTEQTAMRGLVELDLIDGKVLIALDELDRKVDVWALDNANGSSILPGDEGDRLIPLARLAPGKDGAARFKGELGPEAFRGFELDWIYVSTAGMEPTESRLLFSTRDYFVRRYTKRRLAREGFDTSIPPRFQEKSYQEKSVASAIIADRPDQALVTLGLVTQEQFDGADVFFRETFEGNGRSCGTCHPAENNQTIDPPEFVNSLPDSDPLFVAEHRRQGDPISQLEVPVLMRKHGLIVENVDGLEDPTVKFVMRGVPHSLSLATSTSGPGGIDDGIRTGWGGGDGAPAPGTLRMFLLGATIQHYPNRTLLRIPGFDFRLPTDDELDVNVEFMLNVGRLDDVDLGGVSLNNADADSGRVSFINSGCNGCHSNAGANIAAGINLNFQTNVELLFNPATITDPAPLDATEYPFDAGFGTTPTNCDPSDPGPDGFGNCSFNTTPLIEAADTAPLFHNNTAETIEDAVAFYSGPPFPGAPIFPGDVVTQRRVAAFLRVANASFNLQISIQRNEAALVLTGPIPTSISLIGTINKLLDLSIDEGEDAFHVLRKGLPYWVLPYWVPPA